MATVELTLSADTKLAKKSLKGFARRAQQSIRSVESSFNLLKVAAAGAVGFLAGRALVSAVNELTAAAAVQEDAINQLNTALRISGKFSEQTSKSFQEFASQLQQNTRFGDEAILQNAALIQSLGQLEEGALKQATAAAADLSAALGIDLTSAAQLVGKAAAGEVGSFSRYGLVIKKGADASETFARALEGINEKFGGAAAAQINTYSGAVQQLQNVQGDLNEELGFFITKNPLVVQAIKGATSFFTELINEVNNNRDGINLFIERGINAVLKAIPAVIRLIGGFVKVLNGLQLALTSTTVGVLQFAKAFLQFKPIQRAIDTVVDAFKVLGTVVLGTISEIIDFISQIPGVDSALKSLGVNADDASEKILQLGASIGESVGDSALSYDDLAKSIDQSIQSTLDFGGTADGILSGLNRGIASVADLADKKVDELSKSLVEARKNAQKTALEIAQTGVGGAVAGQIQSVVTIKDERSELRKTFDRFVNDIGKQLNKAANQFTGFVESARDFGSQALDVTRDLLSGGPIRRVAETIQQIGEIPELFLQAFRQLDEIVVKFVEQLPGVVTEIVNEIPAIIDALVQNLPILIDALGEAAVIIAKTIAREAPIIAKAIIEGLTEFVKFIPLIVDELAKGIGPLLQTVFQALPSLITAISEIIGPVVRTIADQLPVIAEVFADNIAPIVTALVEGILAASGDIVAALIDSLLIEGGLERIVKALLASIPRIVDAFIRGIILGLQKAVSAIGAVFERGLKAAFNNVGFEWPELPVFEWPPLPEFKWPELPKLEIQGLGGGEGGGLISGQVGGTVGDLAGRIGLAEGGLVSQPTLGLVGEAGPELVVRPRTTENLFKLIDELAQVVGQQSQMAGQGQNLTVNLRIGEQELADVLLNLNRQGFRLTA